MLQQILGIIKLHLECFIIDFEFLWEFDLRLLRVREEGPNRCLIGREEAGVFLLELLQQGRVELERLLLALGLVALPFLFILLPSHGASWI